MDKPRNQKGTEGERGKKRGEAGGFCEVDRKTHCVLSWKPGDAKEGQDGLEDGKQIRQISKEGPGVTVRPGTLFPQWLPQFSPFRSENAMEMEGRRQGRRSEAWQIPVI